MKHKIVEAIVENGQLKRVNAKLPSGRIKVHLIYDVEETTLTKIELAKIIKETSGIYKDINVEGETKKLRNEWERNVFN